MWSSDNRASRGGNRDAPQRWPRRGTNSRRGHFFDAADQDSVLGTNGPGITTLSTASRKAPPLRLMNDGLSLTPRAGAVFLTLSSLVSPSFCKSKRYGPTGPRSRSGPNRPRRLLEPVAGCWATPISRRQRAKGTGGHCRICAAFRGKPHAGNSGDQGSGRSQQRCDCPKIK